MLRQRQHVGRDRWHIGEHGINSHRGCASRPRCATARSLRAHRSPMDGASGTRAASPPPWGDRFPCRCRVVCLVTERESSSLGRVATRVATPSLPEESLAQSKRAASTSTHTRSPSKIQRITTSPASASRRAHRVARIAAQPRQGESLRPSRRHTRRCTGLARGFEESRLLIANTQLPGRRIPVLLHNSSA